MTETSREAELRRIDFTGTMWFGAAVLSIALVGAVTFASGWRPVLGFPLAEADRQKRLCMRAGVATFVGGGILVMLALTLS